MAEPFLSEIRIFSFVLGGGAPKGWAFCNGQILPINQNQALFSLLGTTYGGNGQTTFALPNLRGRAQMGSGNGHTLGETAGATAVTLTLSQMPPHTHPITGTITAVGHCNSGVADQRSPLGNVSAVEARPVTATYSSAAPDANMNSVAVGVTGDTDSTSGGGQPHNNMQPYLVLSFCIALQGIFPSQN